MKSSGNKLTIVDSLLAHKGILVETVDLDFKFKEELGFS